jgi:putative ABC transport system permease protein
MISNYIKIAWRVLNRHRNYSIINVLGLALGLAAGAFTLLYILEENSFDRFHAKGDRIYRVLSNITTADNPDINYSNANGWPVGYTLAEKFPEVEEVLYMRSSSGFSLNYKDTYVDEQIRLAGNTFFTLFDFPLIQGDPATALSKPYSMVLSERMAAKYFPGEDPVGKILTANDTIQFAVTGVVQNPPRHSHIQFDILVSFATWEDGRGNRIRTEGWFNINMLNYILLKEGTDVQAFQKKAATLYMDEAGTDFKQFGYVAELAFEPLQNIYLHSEVYNALGPKGKFSHVLILSGIAAMIILLAAINFINLTTARSVDRAREVGLRKVSGSSRARLMGQFLSESLVTTLVSLLLAFILLGLALPLLNLYTNKNFTLNDWADWRVLISVFSLWLVVGFSAGFYPALILSRYAPLQVLRGQFKTSHRGLALRRTLVVAQFFISVILIAAVFIINRQVNFMQGQSLGFNKEQVLVVNTGKLAYSIGVEKYPVFKNTLLQNSFVSAVSASNGIPGTNGWRGQVAFPEGKSPEESIDTEYLAVDPDYISLLDIEIIAGRNFNHLEADRVDGLLINEATAREMGWGTAENAVGKRILSPSNSPAGLVLGVFKDYHQHGLQERIQPVVMDIESNYLSYYLIRFQPGATQEVIDRAEASWNELFPGYEFKYTFLEDAFAQQYQAEATLNKMFLGFAVVAVVIAAIGLFGLSAFMIVHRTKEIGVRKVLGAPDFSILSLLSRDFIVWVLVGNILAWPVLYWAGQAWLQRFAYRTTLGADLFVLTLFISLGVTLFAISFQAFQAIRMNPTQSLRTE